MISLLLLSIINIAYGNPYGDPSVSPMKATILRLMKYSVYPNNQPFINSKIPPTDVWTNDVVGRFDPNILNLTGIQDSAEYFIGIAPTPQATIDPAIPSVKIIDAFMVDYVEQGSVASAVWDMVFTNNFQGQVFKAHLRTSGFFKFNYNNLISEYDVEALHLGQWEKDLGFDWTTTAIQQEFIQIACFLYMSYCPSVGLHDYSSVPQCIQYFNQNYAFGTPDWMADNTGWCRYIHATMIPLRPQVHCLHAGISGGGKCVATTTNDYVRLDAELPQLLRNGEEDD